METSNKPVLFLDNGKQAQAIRPGQANLFRAQAGEHYRVLRGDGSDGRQQLADGVIARRSGDDLVMDYGDGTRVTLQGYYIACKAAQPCDATLPARDGATVAVTGDEAAGPALADGSTLVHASGAPDALMAMAQGDAGLLAALGGTAAGHAGAVGSGHDTAGASGTAGQSGGGAAQAGDGSGSGSGAVEGGWKSWGTLGGIGFAAGAAGLVAAAAGDDKGDEPPVYPPDTQGSKILSVLVSTAATGLPFKTGNTLTFAVSFTESLIVTGQPQLAVDIGGQTVYAKYSSGSGGNILSFTYTLLAGQQDLDGVSVGANALTLNGGRITDLAGNNAILDHAAVKDDPAYIVDSRPDTVAPTVAGVALAVSSQTPVGALKAGSGFNVVVTMSEVTVVTGKPTVALDIGGQLVQAAYVSGSGSKSLVFSYTILAGQVDANGIAIRANALALAGGTLKDSAGNNAVLAHAAVADNPEFVVNAASSAGGRLLADANADGKDGAHAAAAGADVQQGDDAIAAHADAGGADGIAASTVPAAVPAAVSAAAPVPAESALQVAPHAAVPGDSAPLVLHGAGIAFDLATLAHDAGRTGTVDRIDLTGTGDNRLALTHDDVLHVAGVDVFTNASGWLDGSYDLGGADGKEGRHQLVVDGDAGDALVATGGWGPALGTVVHAATGHVYDVYNAGMDAQLLVDQAINHRTIA